jgi:hypothetical protein
MLACHHMVLPIAHHPVTNIKPQQAAIQHRQSYVAYMLSNGQHTPAHTS